VLDFDKASEIALTKRDVDRKLIPAFVGNDPYYPLPGKNGDDKLWRDFKERYLTLSKDILERRVRDGAYVEDVMDLPKYFTSGAETRIAENGKWDPETQIVFRD
jgi:hypothetical protein